MLVIFTKRGEFGDENINCHDCVSTEIQNILFNCGAYCYLVFCVYNSYSIYFTCNIILFISFICR